MVAVIAGSFFRVCINPHRSSTRKDRYRLASAAPLPDLDFPANFLA